jgi:hypothetical protein
MARYREATPIAGPEAFESAGRDAELSQAAIVLTAGAAVGGRADRIDDLEALALPQGVRRIGRDRVFGVAEAAAPLDVDLRSHVEDRTLRLPGAVSADLTRRLIDLPDATNRRRAGRGEPAQREPAGTHLRGGGDARHHRSTRRRARRAGRGSQVA